jgi:prepilin-type N-terminal cleavage/methylation domain-containing protein
MRSENQNDGFTLIEMSIVLLIIGLIVGAVMLGKTLIRQSQVMSVTTDVQTYIAATKQFQQKYGMLPGDFTGAQALWGINPYCSWHGQGTGTQTCNGDGNGQVGGGSGTSDEEYETILFWQHLANAGLIAGSYSGSESSGGDGFYSIPGTNVPTSKVRGGGYSIVWVGNYPADYCCAAGMFAANYGHIIIFGAQNSWGAGQTNAAVLTAVEAASIDAKIDDGLPGTGNVMGFTGDAVSQWDPAEPLCVNGISHTSAIYNVNTTGAGPSQAVCSILFITGM